MVHHYPKTFWSLLILSYAMVILACYAWIGQRNWPYAASTAGTILLVTFALISISFVGRETAINTRALVGLLDREGKGIKRHDTADVEIEAALIPPLPADRPTPVVVKAQIDPDPGERNRLIAQNTGELQKVAEQARELNKKLDKTS